MRAEDLLKSSVWSVVFGALAGLIGLGALAGWFAHSVLLTAVASGSIPMAPNTALGFVLFAGCVGPLVSRPVSRWCLLPGLGLTALSLIRLFELASGTDLGSSFWVIRPGDDVLAAWGATGGGSPVGRMAFWTAVGFLLLGVGMSVRGLRRPWAASAAGACGLLLAGVGLVFIVGYANQKPYLYGSPLIPMALNTAFGLLFVGVSLVFGAGYQALPLRPFLGGSVRARLLRAFLPVALGPVMLIPLVTAMFRPFFGDVLAGYEGAAIGVVFGIVTLVMCVGVAGEMERELAALSAALDQSQKMEALGRLAGGVAHDFNNLLSVVSGNVSLLLEDLERQPGAQGRVRAIAAAVERAAALTGRLLAFSRKEGIGPVGSVEVGPAVAGLVELMKIPLGSGLRVVWTVPEGVWPVRAGAGEFDQVLMNLLLNARDAMPAGGDVTVDAVNRRFDPEALWAGGEIPPGRYVELRVSDAGAGMSVEVLAHVFEPFFTTKPRGEGTGLGLATVHRIVTGRGGRVRVASSRDRGTTFHVLWPAA